MSGGSLDYLYVKIQNAADLLNKDRKTHRRAFASHLNLIAEALRRIEWVDSSDCSPGDEKESILACINPNLMFMTLIQEATQIRDELNSILQKAKK